MQIQRCLSPVCGRPFQVNRFDTRLPTTIERGKITCPHCGLAIAAASDSVFLTHALAPDEEARLEVGECTPMRRAG